MTTIDSITCCQGAERAKKHKKKVWLVRNPERVFLWILMHSTYQLCSSLSFILIATTIILFLKIIYIPVHILDLTLDLSELFVVPAAISSPFFYCQGIVCFAVLNRVLIVVDENDD